MPRLSDNAFNHVTKRERQTERQRDRQRQTERVLITFSLPFFCIGIPETFVFTSSFTFVINDHIHIDPEIKVDLKQELTSEKGLATTNCQ